MPTEVLSVFALLMTLSAPASASEASAVARPAMVEEALASPAAVEPLRRRPPHAPRNAENPLRSLLALMAAGGTMMMGGCLIHGLTRSDR